MLHATMLLGLSVQLEPLNETHKADLYAIAQHPEIWTFHASNALGDHFNPWFEKSLQGHKSGKYVQFTVRELEKNRIIGCTRYYDIHEDHLRLAIGGTWYLPEFWGTSANPECKYLLLKYAFETLKFNRVEFKTDARNARSRAAIKKLGANEEGVLRQHMVLENKMIRDSVVYSIIRSEWSEVKHNLEQRLYQSK